jgi:hypothetical protein
MFLSTVVLNERGKDFYSDPALLRCRLWQCFPDSHRKTNDPTNIMSFVDHHFGHSSRRSETSNFLYAIHQNRNQYVIVMRSGANPDLDYAFNTIPEMLVGSVQTKFVPIEYTEGEKVNFFLRINPVNRERQLCHPFGLLKSYTKDCCEFIKEDIVGSRIVRICKRYANQEEEGHFSIQQTDLCGQLIVKNPVEFKNIVVQGVGRAKTYGCGLIMTTRIK